MSKLEKLEMLGEGRVYWFERPGPHARIRFRGAIVRAGGSWSGPFALLNLLAAGINELMEGQPQVVVDALRAKVERQRKAFTSWGEALKTGDLEAVKSAEAVVAAGEADLFVTRAEVLANYKPYATAVGNDSAYWPLVGIEAARAFLRAWEGFDLELKRNELRVLSEESLEAIPESDLAMIGMFVDGLCRPSSSAKAASK